MDGSDKLRSTDVLHQLRARWEPTYGGLSAQQFATALEQRGVEVRKRSLDGQPGQRVVLAADITAALDTPHPGIRPIRGEGTCLTPSLGGSALPLTCGKADNSAEAD